MDFFKTISSSVYIIAEIGQNHQGCIETAKSMIVEAKNTGCHCVKFQKSDLTAKFTRSALDREYISEHAWGLTYGKHKEYLEFSKEQYKELQSFCKNLEIDFTASAMDENSLEFLAELNVPFIKIGSGDANNFPLLKKASGLNVPLIISTGMQKLSTVDEIVSIMTSSGKEDYILMHCVSAYPTPAKDCNLQLIPMFMNRYPKVTIGYSGHELGIIISQAAVLAGARVIERHFTLDKTQKGSDHRCSLEPTELKALVDNINELTLDKRSYSPPEIIKLFEGSIELVDAFQDVQDKQILKCELPCRRKLGKSVVTTRDMKKGEHLRVEDLAIKVSEPSALPAEEYYMIIGKELLEDVAMDEAILPNSILL